MHFNYRSAISDKSPSPRRAWIEIIKFVKKQVDTESPSPRRAWIEIYFFNTFGNDAYVALPAEGVD